MDPQTFNLTVDGTRLPPITVSPFVNKSTGAVMSYDQTGTETIRIEKPSMAEWRATIKKRIRNRVSVQPATRHIAIIALADHGEYKLSFWPVVRRESIDGRVWWAEMRGYHTWEGYLPACDLEWDDIGGWTESSPHVWREGLQRATILDWSDDTWAMLIAIRNNVDEAFARLAQLLSTPQLLPQAALPLLSAGEDQ